MGGQPPRVVLLGASNLTLGLGTVVAQTRRILAPSPPRILVAAGHGRSYGAWSRVALRGLPGIRDCGLWEALEPGGGPVYGLVTDIGNDLLYGSPPERIAGWVETCLERLRDRGARVVLTSLPTESMARLQRWQYHLVKALYYPGRRCPYGEIRRRVGELDGRLRELGARPGVTLAEPQEEWYGPDRIHIRRRHRAEAWGRILAAWKMGGRQAAATPRPPRPAPRLRRLAPEHRTVLGIELRRPQPAAILPDGTTISLY